MRFLQPKTAMTRHWRHFYQGLVATVLTVTVSPIVGIPPALAQATGSCQLSPREITEKDDLRQATLTGDPNAGQRYQSLLAQHAEKLRTCRSKTWPQNEALWLRLYPCDAKPGGLDALLDRIASKGYNEVYIEVFYDGQVLLPAANNPTPWPSVVRSPGADRVDLLADAIAKGHQRGLKVYAWLFTMNFGYSYSQLPDRQDALARNGKGETTLTIAQAADIKDNVAQQPGNHAFIDPYSPQARRDYTSLVNSALQRRPDGMLFDYVRYLRGTGSASVVSQVEDLWIYSQASEQTLYQRGLNQKGRELIRRFLTQGSISAADIEEVDQLYPTEGEPLWQGRTPPTTKTVETAAERLPQLQWELWYLSVAHAVQGILDFVNLAVQPVQRQGIPAGAVFFPTANRPVGQGGYDSRLQPWDRFPSSMQWHPMAYANCGKTNCIIDEIERVLKFAPRGTEVIPALAGTWGRSVSNRPSLEDQMQALRQLAPRINSVSHFAYSWQEPDSDNARKFCQLQ